MEEEGDLVRCLVAAHVAREGVAVAMVSHVHGIHDHVLECHVAKLALMCALPLHVLLGLLLVLHLLLLLVLFQGHEWWEADLRGASWGVLVLAACVLIMAAAFTFGALAQPHSNSL